MTVECRVCGAPAQLFLCRTHIDELAELLGSLVSGGAVSERVMGGRTSSGGVWFVERQRHLAGLIQHLEESAVGQARHGGDGGRRAKRRDTHLQGESTLASHIEVFPTDDESDLGRARRQRERAALAHALAQGGVNAAASDLLSKLRRLLNGWDECDGTQHDAGKCDGTHLEGWVHHNGWVDDVTDATGVRYSPPGPFDLAGAAAWVAEHSTALANLERAGRIFSDAHRMVSRIERAINRRVPPRFCGQCTATVVRDGREQRCGLAVYAPREAIEVPCPGCATVHNIERLFNQQLVESAYLRFTREELIGNQRTNDDGRYWTGLLGELGEFVHWRTFHRWTAPGGPLRPDGFRRPDGRIGMSRRGPDDQPMWRLSNVRKVARSMADQSGPKKAGVR